jgi:hypothetical protein
MNRRGFVTGLGMTFTSASTQASPSPQNLSIDGTTFRSWHVDGRLVPTFTAPTLGWVAVGFNNQQHLEGARFVIGAMIGGSFHTEEHIAVVPDHPRVQELGIEASVEDVVGSVSNNETTMQFSLPHLPVDSDNPTLLSGTSSYLMLAWSHHTDLDHHSAWRRHFPVDL